MMSVVVKNEEVALAADTSLTGFYRDMTRLERRTFWACVSGYSLDGMDFMIYPLVLSTITKQWNVSSGTAGLAATLTLLSSALGGWLAGFLCDRIGRVRMLQITIIWFSFFSLLCAVVQDFHQLIIARTLLGLGFGGEWAAGAVLMGETIQAQFRGRAVGCVQSGWAVGWGLAVALQAIAFSVLPPDQAWRWMFAFGALPALLVFFLRRYVKEPDVSVANLAQQKQAGTAPKIWEIFHRPIVNVTALATLTAMGAQGGYYAVATWLPTFLKADRGLTVVGSTGYLSFLIAGAFTGYLVGAWLADRIGRRALFLVFSAGATAVVLAYTQLPIPNEIMLLLGFPLGFFASGYFSGMGPFLTELFPTRLRGSGQGFSYNFGRGVGALFPALVGYLSALMPLADAMALFAVLAYSVFFLAAYALPETRGRVLHADT
jgi:MFS family permease